ncbi:AsmA family protein [Sphingomonas mollis]|uniref:AsmA family protein n=1 Tax=Sphingomonas mollis TaxID=2795726 RepID=UPI001E5C8E2C|nr:AsmA family protein [Sphingomonas sp. BT553]
MGNRTARIVAAVAAIVAVLLLILAAFPWGILRGIVEREATERFGRPVSIGAVERVDHIGFTPTIAIRNVRIAQADWVGPGDFARIDAVTVSFPVWPLLTGDFRPHDVVADGLRLALARDAQGRTNWGRPGKQESGGGSTDLGALTVRNAVISYADAKQDRQVTVAVAADPVGGLRVKGRGRINAVPVALTVTGPAPVAGKPWPFTATIDGNGLAMRTTGTMDRPLDTDAMTLDVTARATDLKLIDAVIEAGLFRTRPVALHAQVRRDPDTWTITGLHGTIGRSDIAGHLAVKKVDGRSKIDGAITSRAFDFADLTSAEGRAEAAALERRIGPRLVPNTRIDIGKIQNTDGRLSFRVGRIIGANSPPIVSMAGTLVMDHRLLTLAPLRLSLAQGRVTGRAVVDQRRGQRSPTLTLDLRLADGEVGAFAAGGQFTGRLAARVRLAGVGDTIRDAVGRSDGSVGFVVVNGRLPARYAAALGFDAGRALLAGSSDRTALRCLVTRLSMHGGTGRADPLLIDTAVSQLTGTGTVSFPDERLAFVLRGAPKQSVLLRIPGSATVGGTLQNPALSVPPQVKSVGNIFKAIGNRITGHSGPVATDADCRSLTARALR